MKKVPFPKPRTGETPDQGQVQHDLALVHEGYFEGACNECGEGEQESVLVRHHPQRPWQRQCPRHAGRI